MQGRAPSGEGQCRGMEDAQPVPGFLGNRATRAAAQSAAVPSTSTYVPTLDRSADALVGMRADVGGIRSDPSGKDSPYEDDDEICAAIQAATGDAWSAMQ